ncbi:hypothetical protein DFH08DRAFT_984077 [Mycena albidolilacea]|uniref:Uncharacterized protein n=1 Tax=Mycena albidolilacea TaxID=1033008 RepID=A0AAD7AW47_9AGAR|nr:hypothetical protein DFH08DRAFT_984062 [Mycena albidolilacea]KAJ7369148.1 hypothetical protein DFH08DRAFT_984077 [Mycena albidolilacea]
MHADITETDAAIPQRSQTEHPFHSFPTPLIIMTSPFHCTGQEPSPARPNWAGPSETLSRKLSDVIKTVNSTMLNLSDLERETVHPQIEQIVMAFAGNEAEDVEIARALCDCIIGTFDFKSTPLRATVFPGSPTMTIREPNIALAVLLARAERASFIRAPLPSPESLLERACRAGIAYAGITNILSALTGTGLAGMISVCVTDEATPFMAFGSTIVELPGPIKEQIRSLRDRELQSANPGIIFLPGPRELKGGSMRGHCAELPSLYQIAPQIRIAHSANRAVYTIAFRPIKLSGLRKSTEKVWWLAALDAFDVSTLQELVREGKAFKEACENCVQLMAEMFVGPIVDLGDLYKRAI